MSTTTTVMSDADLDALLSDLGAAPSAPIPAAAAAAPAAEAVAAEPVAAAAAPAVAATELADDDLADLGLDTPAEAVAQPAAVSEPEPEPTPEPQPEPTPEPAPAPAPEPTPAPVAAAKPASSAGMFKIVEYVDAETLKRDVRISMSDLDDAMVKHAGLFVHYAEQAVKARAQHDRMKNHQSVLEAKLDAEHREKLSAEGKKFTEAVVTAAVAGDARMAKINQLVGDAHAIWKLAEVAANAFDQRKDMILELARDRRKEREGQLRVLENTAMRDKANAVAQAASSRAA